MESSETYAVEFTYLFVLYLCSLCSYMDLTEEEKDRLKRNNNKVAKKFEKMESAGNQTR